MWKAIIIVLLIVGFYHALTTARVVAPPEAPVVIVPPLSPIPDDFFEVAGTIEYTRNNVGDSVPYVVYKSSDGDIATKAIVFGNASECETRNGSYPCALIQDALPLYFGAGPVRITGTVVSEHVTVDRMTLA